MFDKNSYLIFHILQEVQEYNVSTLSQCTVSLNTMCTQHDDLNQLLSMPLNCTLHPNTLDPGPWTLVSTTVDIEVYKSSKIEEKLKLDC